MQDPNPLPWGALDRYQAHFIVRKNAGSSAINYTAKTILSQLRVILVQKLLLKLNGMAMVI